MRAVVQRVSESSVRIAGEVVGEIQHGLLVLLGVAVDDEGEDARFIAEKIAGLRIFNDDDGKFNLSIEETGGSALVISQFTLLGDSRKGRRPSFIKAARPEQAVPLYEDVVSALRQRGLTVATGVFGAQMDVHLVNDGPVTLLIDSKKGF